MVARYQRWLITRGNSFAPAPASIVKLVERLRKEKWIPDLASPDFAKLRFEGKREQHAKATGAYAVRTVDNEFGEDAAAKIAASTEAVPAALTKEWIGDPGREELRLVWPVSGPAAVTAGLEYPLSMKPEGDASWALEIHRCDEYVYPTADTIGPLPTICNCKEDLSFEWDDEELVPTFASSSGIFAECEECSRTFDPSQGTAELKNPFDGSTTEVRGGAAYRFAIKVDCGKSFVADAKLAFNPKLVALIESEFGRELYEVGCGY